jgi:hypothetical protein
MFATSRVLDVSIATGMMGYMFPVYAIPIVGARAGDGGAGDADAFSHGRRVGVLSAVVIACGAWTLLRTGGFSGYIDHDFAWRWTKTPEERLLAQANDEPPPPPTAAPAAATAPGRAPAAVAAADDKRAPAPADLPAAAPPVARRNGESATGRLPRTRA